MKQKHSGRIMRIVKDFILLSFKEFVWVVILTSLLIFLSFIVHTRTEPGEIGGFIVVNFGFPVEWFRITANAGSWYSTMTHAEILWGGLAVDIILFALLSIVLLRVTDRVADSISPRQRARQL